MAKKKINAGNIIKLTGATTVLSSALGASSSYFLAAMYPQENISTWGCMLVAWTIPHSYVFLAGIDSLREELRFKSPIRIAGNWTKRTFGRQIPVNAGEKKTNVFMQTLQLMPGSPSVPSYDPVELESVLIWYNENSYTLTLPDLEEFLYSAWRRQTQKKNGLSRDYWTKQRRPRLKTLEYNIRIMALISVDGLILDRSESRSGRLAVPPNEAIKAIRRVY